MAVSGVDSGGVGDVGSYRLHHLERSRDRILVLRYNHVLVASSDRLARIQSHHHTSHVLDGRLGADDTLVVTLLLFLPDGAPTEDVSRGQHHDQIRIRSFSLGSHRLIEKGKTSLARLYLVGKTR